MTDYQNLQELISHIDQEGLDYFFVHYTDAKSITVGGHPLPDHILEAAEALCAAVATLYTYFGDN